MAKRRRRRREEAPAPLSSAGLVRFFEEEIKGIEVPPHLVLLLAVGLIIIVILARLIAPV